MKQNIFKDMAQLMRYRLANAAAQAKNFNEWLTDRSVVSMHGAGHAPHRINQQVETMIEREDVNLAVAVRNIADAIAWLPLNVFESEIGDDGREILMPAHEHPFVALWREPNEKHATTDIILHLVMSWLLTGNAYLHIERGASRGNVLNPLGDVSLWPIASWTMFVERDKTTGKPIGYTQNPRAWNEVNYELDEVVHFMQYSPADPIYGRSGLEPLKRQLWTEYQAELMTLGFFANDGTPRAVFIPEGDVGPDQVSQIEDFYKARANPDDKNRLQVMPMKGELKAITPTMKDMEFIEMRRFNRERTYAMMGLPPFLGGDMQHANFANAKMQDETFWRNRLMPVAKKMADTLMRQLLWRMGDKTFVLKHDTSKIEALQGDKLKKARTNSLLISGGIMSQNEVRVMEYDLERIDTPEADAIQVHRTNAGGDVDNQPVAGAPSGSDKRRKKVKIVTRSATNQVIDTKAVDLSVMEFAWNKFNQVVLDNEPVLIAALKKWYQGQLKRVLDALVDTTIQGRFMSQLAPSIRVKDHSHLDFFLSISAEDEMMTNIFSPIIHDLMEKIGAEQSAAARAASPFDIGTDFDVDNPKVQIAIQNLTNRIVATNHTTFKAIRGILKRGFGDGSSVQEVAKQITAKFKEFSLSRSMTVARTEMTGIANSASNHAWQSWGATHKTWVATLDDLTRDYHVQYNGERVAINDSYKFGPEPLLYPGDPNASLAANVINCRCTEVYDFDPLTQQELTDLELQGLALPG